MWKVPKGTFDIVDDYYQKLEYVSNLIRSEFETNGGQPLETPVFERTDVLLGKYGEEADTKLVYRLEDEGGELLALRYDHTIPFVRYIKENNVKKMRRYCIGKVYRRDQPNKHQARYREFYQADFDILGEQQDGMLAEAMLLSMVANVLRQLKVDFEIFVNDVSNIHFLLTQKLRVDNNNWKRLCPIIDKLDKTPFEKLKSEFLEVDATLNLNELQDFLVALHPWQDETCESYNKLIELADVHGFSENLVFSNSLARGLDYYTGFIWEIKVKGHQSSIAAGGRYDGLVNDLPLVGISFGISRMLSIITDIDITMNLTTCYITSLGNVSHVDVVKAANKIKKENGFKVKYSLSVKPKKLVKILSECIAQNIHYLIILAEDEWKQNKVLIKDITNKTQCDVYYLSDSSSWFSRTIHSCHKKN